MSELQASSLGIGGRIPRCIFIAARTNKCADTGAVKNINSEMSSSCALNPGRDEASIARAIRDSSATAMPNIMLVSHADRILGRKGRMIAAVEALGPGRAAAEGEPFRLDLE